MENEERDIIRQLADKLSEQELPYREGAWERFAAREAGGLTPVSPASAAPDAVRQTGRLIRLWAGVAAALILAAGAGWLYLSGRQHADRQVVITASKELQTGLPVNPQAANPANQPAPGGTENRPNTRTALLRNTAAGTRSGFSFPNLIQHKEIIPLNHTNTFSQKDRELATAIAGNALASIPANGQHHLPVPGLRISPVGPVFTLPAPPTVSGQPGAVSGGVAVVPSPGTNLPEHPVTAAVKRTDSNALASGNQPARVTTTIDTDPGFDDSGYFGVDAPTHAGKWSMGLMVIPAVSNDAKLNMGYGLSVGYKLNNRLSLNSGLAYTQLTGSRNADQGASVASASGGRMLSSIDATATGLNVPLELRYHISQKIYVGTGVSAMALLSDKVERNYAIADMQTSAFETNTGLMLKPGAMQSIASNMQAKEVIPDDQVGSKDFAGFINFTFGFKQPLNKRKSLSVEPFISIPMSNHLFNQNIKMTDGGIRIKLGL